MIPDAATNVKEEGTAFQDSCMEKKHWQSGRNFCRRADSPQIAGHLFFLLLIDSEK